MPWNRSRQTQQKVSKKKLPSKWKIALATMSVVVVASVILWPSRVDTNTENKNETKRIRKTKAVASPKTTRKHTPASVPAEKIVKAPKEMYLGQEVVSHSYKTNSTGRSVREVIVTADGKKHGRTTVIAKPTFKYGTDQMLADVLFPQKHGPSAPWPEMDAKALDKEFARSILDPIVISKDDPEDVRIKKEAVKQARSEMIQLIKEGNSVLDIIRQQHDFNEGARELRLTVTKELYNLRKEGASSSDIREYLERANQLLEQQGIEPVAETQKKGSR